MLALLVTASNGLAARNETSPPAVKMASARKTTPSSRRPARNDEPSGNNVNNDRASGTTTTTRNDAEKRLRATFVGAAMSLRGGSHDMVGALQVSVARNEESFAYAPGPLGLRVWMSRPWHRLGRRVGREVRWVASLTGDPNHGGTQADGSETYRFGTLLEPSAGLETALASGFQNGLDFPISVRAGLPVLIPRDDFAALISDLRDVGALPGPRFGVSVGASVGMRKRLTSRWSVRGDLGADAVHVWLLRTRATINDVAYQKDWRLGILRMSLQLGLEVTL